jgi:hypothetical protein
MIPIGLEANKKLMETQFDMLSMKGTAMAPDTGGAIYKAAYHAHYDKAYERLMETNDPDDADIKADLATKGMLKMDNIKNLQNESHEFASFFADAMKECLDEIANQIDSHIKSMMINIITTAPGPSGTVLACGVGPVSGTIAMNNMSPTGGITIS